ncbi:hypothetical protein [Xanthomonas hortorum]|uniref:hypothetical protein n=1 Tax=Xanthomonas hortorum TaxID=56454 RepID=UPI001593EFCD|nr:hypothetical protein [Xanthomonas hortorum]NHF65984.1 hypothetical protein [Xanthomonas hortorum]
MSMSVVVNQAKQVEGRLQALGAIGRGLHEKANSVEQILGSKLTKRIRFLASVRNQVVHNPEVELTPELLSSFLSAAEDALGELDRLLTTRSESSEGQQSDNRVGESPLGPRMVAVWDSTSTGGKIGLVIGAVALSALYVKGKIDDWW